MFPILKSKYPVKLKMIEKVSLLFSNSPAGCLEISNAMTNASRIIHIFP